MSKVIFFPGALSPVFFLDDVLRESHEAMRDDRAGEIEARLTRGVPLDDETQWPLVTDALAEADRCNIARDTAGVAAAASKAHALVAGHKLVAFAPYESVPHYVEMHVRFRALSDAQRRLLLADVARTQDALTAGVGGPDFDAHLQLRNGAVGAFVIAAVERIDGHTPDDELVEALVISGMLLDVFSAARDYQRLSVGKGERFGSPALRT